MLLSLPISAPGAYFLLSAGIVTFFIFVTLFELWVLHKLGFDVWTHLRIKSGQKRTTVLLEAYGVVAFLIAQPIIFSLLLRNLFEAIMRVITK